MKKRDFSQYKRIHHIGDVHGCYTALMKYLDDNGGIKDDEFYIFTGDYIDRGVENAEVVNFLISIMESTRRRCGSFTEGLDSVLTIATVIMYIW